ncbi:unnamed protein product [Calicophoron daubneyi]|uniref:CUB domain-containing protein n=1 Tax=Calicophoron daubneyi TaxID=300641 RepID=A0AAV2TDT7_CALDB
MNCETLPKNNGKKVYKPTAAQTCLNINADQAKQVDPTAFGGCGGNVHLSTNSRFGSPLKGGLYPPNQLCVWTLHAKLQLHAMIQYIMFDMNDEKSCCKSHVSVYDGMYGDSKRLARNCTLGNVKDYAVMGSSESLTVVFYTTNGLQHKGISVLAQGFSNQAVDGWN